MNVKQIVADWLKAHGYDGLSGGDGDCACVIGDLMPCGNVCVYCKPGYRQPCPDTCGDHDFHIGPRG